MMTGTVPFKLFRPVAFNASGDGVAAQTISGALVLTFLDEQFQRINGGAASRDVTLPTADPEHKGCIFVIANVGTTNNLVVKNGVSTIVTLLPGQEAICVQSATAWVVLLSTQTKDTTIAAATGTAIPVTQSGSFPITQNGAETNTLPNPTFMGQWLNIFVDTDTSGARVITAASRINQAGQTIITLTAVGAFIKLEAITIGGALRWQVVASEGASLS